MKVKMMLSSWRIRLDLMLSSVRLELMSRVPGAAAAASCTLATALKEICDADECKGRVRRGGGNKGRRCWQL
jgi:hypothetical protein